MKGSRRELVLGYLHTWGRVGYVPRNPRVKYINQTIWQALDETGYCSSCGEGTIVERAETVPSGDASAAAAAGAPQGKAGGCKPRAAYSPDTATAGLVPSVGVQGLDGWVECAAPQ